MKTFRLSREPSAFQLGYHLSNLVTYFHPVNDDLKMKLECDKNITATTSQVLRVFEFLMFEYNTELVEIFLNKREEFPIHFRCSQIIQCYGKEYIRNYIRMIYGKDV